jgi:hypothetical protein
VFYSTQLYSDPNQNLIAKNINSSYNNHLPIAHTNGKEEEEKKKKKKKKKGKAT